MDLLIDKDKEDKDKENDEEDDEEKDKENEEDKDEDILGLEEDLLEQLDEEEDNDFENEEEEINDEFGADEQPVSKRKPNRSKNRDKDKSRQIPFIAKKRLVASNKCREEPNWHGNIREYSCKWLSAKIKSPEKGSVIEKHVFNAAVRSLRSIGVKKLNSMEFKQEYRRILYWFAGVWNNSGLNAALNELKQDKSCWNSEIWSKQKQIEIAELNKITNPANTSEYPDHPCPKCHKIRHLRVKKQLRGADEGESAIFYCGNTSCNNTWRVNG